MNINDIDKDLLTIKEVCEIIRNSRPTVYSHIKNGTIKAVKIGRFWRVPKTEIEKFIKQEKKE